MKNKRSATIPALLAAAALAALLHAAPPEGTPPSPEVLAKRKVGEIYARMNPVERPFSRVAPILRHTLEFQPQQLVNNESRLPFVIRRVSIIAEKSAADKPAAAPEMQGYVRLSDQEVFLLDPKTGAYQPAPKPRVVAPPAPPVPIVPSNPA